MTADNLVDTVNWNGDGLVPVIAQDHRTGTVLMLAWMNADALRCTVAEGRAVYWSRSRASLWRKGESSGHVQLVHDLRLDCDGDTLLLKVEQRGGIACHTGRAHCFFQAFEDGQWREKDAVLRDPREIYGTAD